jgi:SAM-dependent methyltransferase
MRELPLDLLACPTCRGPLAEAPGALACRACGVAFPRTAESANLVPAALDRTASGEDADWTRWREANLGLDAWRAVRRRLRSPAQLRLADTPDGDAMRVLFQRAGLRGAVVDIGAKDGRKLELMPSGLRYLGIDPFPKDNPALPAHAAVVRGFVEALPVADGVADAVLSLASFDYFVDPEAALVEVARILRPGGVFAVLLSVLTPAVVRARSAASLPDRLLRACAAFPEVGLRGTALLLADTVTIRKRFHMRYYTRQAFFGLLDRRFEVAWQHERPQPASTILYVVARKR